MGRRDSHMARMHKRLEVDKTSRVFARLADAFRQSDHVDEAIELCHQGLTYHPDYISGHVVLGQCYLDQGRLVEARETFQRALVLDEQNAMVLSSLGHILFRQGQLEEAAARYRQALALDPRNVHLQKMLREVEARRQEEMAAAEASTADESADESEQRSPEGTWPTGPLPLPSMMDVPMFGKEILEERSPQEHRLWILGEEGASAEEEAGSEAGLSPEETELLRDSEDDRSDKGPPRGMATATLAEIYFQQGLLDKAIEIYQKVLRHHPDDDTSRERLAVLRAMRSDRTQNNGAGEDTSPLGPSSGETSEEAEPREAAEEEP